MFTRKEKEVWQACEALWEEGHPLEKITGDAVAQQLLALGYKKGSLTDLHQHRRSWLSYKNTELSKIPPHENPQVPSDRISKAAATLRAEVYAQLEEEFTQAKELAQQQVKVALQDQEAKQLECEMLLKEKNGLAQSLDQLHEKYSKLHAAYQKVKTELSLSFQREKILKEEYETRYVEYSTTLQTLKQLHEQYREDTQVFIKTKETAHQLNISDYKSLMENQRHQWIKTQDELKTQNKKLAALLQKEKEHYQGYKKANETLMSRIKESEKMAVKLNAENQKLADKLMATEMKLFQSEAKANSLSEQSKGNQILFTQIQKQLHQVNAQQQKLSQHLITYPNKNEK
jgi:uncharacterized phage infection (PIP) family protein YhgE